MNGMPVWIWDGDGPECRLTGVRGTREEAKAACEHFLEMGTVVSAAVELAYLASDLTHGTYYEHTGYGWSATLLNSVQHGAEQGSAPRSDVRVVWVPFDEIRERMHNAIP